ncbi:ABC transporter ATP-binding protein [bacterium]|nr:multidrug ABC transporter ATP-binding protein [Gammaproteobacteria bacterium]MDC3340063.1 ABC transporter ATP-binding protein [bacterium]
MSSSSKNIIKIQSLNKVYGSDFEALKGVNLDIRRGEVLALLGPNGAGKTTLISAICGIVRPSSGVITVDGHDIQRNFRITRSLIGLVPQELTTDSFETVWNTVSFSRGLFGKEPCPDHIEAVLRSLSLWDKKDNMLRTLSGGMKRRVLIAKALSHEPRILFLDEPTAGVDVSLRKDMWKIVEDLKTQGVTIILTTHYIEEAEEIADRIGVINHGKLILIEEKNALMSKLGKKQLLLELTKPLDNIPSEFQNFDLVLSEDQHLLTYTFDSASESHDISEFLIKIQSHSIQYKDLRTKQSSLEEIFVTLVQEAEGDKEGVITAE